MGDIHGIRQRRGQDSARFALPAWAASIFVLAAALALVAAGALPQPAWAASGQSAVNVAQAPTGKVVLKKGSSYALGATARKAKLTYRSSAPKVASVSPKGVVKAKRPGKATVTVKAKWGVKAATKKVKVTVVAKRKYRQVRGVTAKAANAGALKLGSSTKVEVSFTPSKASNRNVTFKSSAPSVAKVSASGVVTAKKAGTARITATSCANKKVKATVTVKVAGGTSGGGSSGQTHVSNPVKYDDGTADYADDVVAAVSTEDARVSDDGTRATVDASALPSAPEPGEVVVVSDDNLQGTAIKVESAERNADGTYTVSGTRPDFDEVFDELQLRGTEEYDPNSAEVLYVADGVEVTQVEDGGPGGLAAQADEDKSRDTKRGTKLKLDLGPEFFAKYELDLSKNVKAKVEGSVSVTVTPFVDYEVDYNKWWPFKVNRLKVLGGVEAEVEGKLKAGVELKVPVPALSLQLGKTKVDVYVTAGLDGTISVSYDAELSVGVDYTRGMKGSPIVGKAEVDGSTEWEVEGKIGVGAEAELGLLCFDVGEASAELGAKAAAKETFRSADFMCLDLNAWLYAEAKYKVEADIAKWCKFDPEATWTIMDKDTSPLRWSAHLDNGKKVGATDADCTWNASPGDGGDNGGSGSGGGGGGAIDDGPGDGGGDSPVIGPVEPVTPGVPDVSGVPVRAAVGDYSWAELKSISNAIAAASSDSAGLAVAKKYNLVDASGKLQGDAKPVTLADGTQTSVRILGFRHDGRADGAGKAGISFEFQDVVAMREMNNPSSNEGGWRDSDMRAYLNGSFVSQIPAEVSELLVAVSKRTNNVGNNSSGAVAVVTATSDTIWLPSVAEVYGAIGQSSTALTYPAVYNTEGKQYKLYSDKGVTESNGTNFCVKYTVSGSRQYCWLRSPDSSRSYIFHAIDPTGSPNGKTIGSGAWSALGVSPGFCF